MKCRAQCVLFLCVALRTAYSAPYEELVPKFNRVKSNAMVRRIQTATLANLDYAAYNANPIITEKEKFKSRKPAQAITLESITFDGLLLEVRNTIAETPLSDEEKQSPMAWRPLTKRLWEVVKEPSFQNITSKINGYKWADPDIYAAYQQIEAAYLHATPDAAEIWVRIEFAPWVTFVRQCVSDADDDGLPEIYGRLSLAAIPGDSLDVALTWIREDYCARVLGRQEVVDWITDWASYWYPTKNTDLLEPPGDGVWPDAETEKTIVRTMKGVTVKDPVAIVRGRPTGDIKKPFYNVYVVEGLDGGDGGGAGPGKSAAISGKKMDTSVSKNFTGNSERFAKELKDNGGDYAAWAKKYAKFIEAQKQLLATLPESQMGFEGTNDWVFFRKSLEYSTAGDLAKQASDKNPLPHLKDLKAYLDKNNVNLLFVAVPVKSEVYFEYLPVKGAPADKTSIVNPCGRKILKDIQDAGIEVIDLLPDFLAAKAQDAQYDETVYQKQDTHWTNRGLQIAAEKIARRVKAYSWYNDAAAEKVDLVVVDTTFERQGDIVDKLPETARPKYPALTLAARQVRRADGTPYRGDKTAPIILMGDSFTGVFELIDCKSAGVGSNIAAQTGIPVEVITSWGGGPLVRQKMVRARGTALDSKRLIVYMMVARDLYDYSQLWAPLEVE